MASNPIVVENANGGTVDWKIPDGIWTAQGPVSGTDKRAPLDTTTMTTPNIEGYASATSVNIGGSIDFFVNTWAPTYTLEIFRMGCYGGMGGRLMMPPVTGLKGIVQPSPTSDPNLNGMTYCQNWQPVPPIQPGQTSPHTLVIPNTWCSGVYLVKLTTEDGAQMQSYITFVVRDDHRKSDIVFQCCVTTYEAYNMWGGKSLYLGLQPGSNPVTYDYADRSYGVSFNRPYLTGSGPGDYQHGGVYGAGDFLFWEYQMLRWLEANGYDVTYVTNLDTETRPKLLLNHKVFLSAGHDEYWSMEMRNALQAALKKGVSLAFFGANAVYWQVRFTSPTVTGSEPRIMVCYKDGPAVSPHIDPLYGKPTTTTQWRSVPVSLPEDAVLGQMWESFYQYNFPWIAGDVTQWPFQGTNIAKGEAFPSASQYQCPSTVNPQSPPTNVAGIVGYEYDLVYNGSQLKQLYQDPPDSTSYKASPPPPYPPNLIILAQSPCVAAGGPEGSGGPATFLLSHSNTTLYAIDPKKGPWVFAAGTNSWSWGLDDYFYPYQNTGLYSPEYAAANGLPPPNPNQMQKLQQLTKNILDRMVGSSNGKPACGCHSYWPFNNAMQ